MVVMMANHTRIGVLTPCSPDEPSRLWVLLYYCDLTLSQADQPKSKVFKSYMISGWNLMLCVFTEDSVCLNYEECCMFRPRARFRKDFQNKIHTFQKIGTHQMLMIRMRQSFQAARLGVTVIVLLWNSMMTSSNGNIFGVTGHSCGEFTGPRWIPRTKPVTQGFDVFFDLRLNKRLSKQSWGWWFEMPIAPIMTSP